MQAGSDLRGALRALLLEHGQLHPHTLACLLMAFYGIDTTGEEVQRALNRR